MSAENKSLAVSMIALLASSGTLVCCALPIILVSLGLGSVVAALNVQLPFLSSLADYKFWTFMVSGGLLLFAAWQLYATRNTCPADPKLVAACARIKKITTKLLIIASVIWMIGFIAAYIALPIRIWLGV